MKWRLTITFALVLTVTGVAHAQRIWILDVDSRDGPPNWNEEPTGGCGPAHGCINEVPDDAFEGKYWWYALASDLNQAKAWYKFEKNHRCLGPDDIPSEPRPYLVETFVPAAHAGTSFSIIEVRMDGKDDSESFFWSRNTPWNGASGTNRQWIKRNASNQGDFIATGPGPHTPDWPSGDYPSCGAGENGTIVWLKKGSALNIQRGVPGDSSGGIGVSAIRITELIEDVVTCDTAAYGGPIDMRCVGNADPLAGIGDPNNPGFSQDNDKFGNGHDKMVSQGDSTVGALGYVRPCSDSHPPTPYPTPLASPALPANGMYTVHDGSKNIPFKLRYDGWNTLKWDAGERRGDTWDVTGANWLDTASVTGGNWVDTINVTAANWDDSPRRINQGGGIFSAYQYQSGDRFQLTNGTGVNLGDYGIKSKVSNDTIELESDINGGSGNINDNSIQGYILTRYISQSGAFAGYAHRGGDTIVITSGTGVTPGTYAIRSKVNDNTIRLESNQDINGAGGNINDNSVQGTISAKLLIQAGAFTGYPYRNGDTITITAGTGVTPGVYNIKSKVDDNTLKIDGDINGAGGNIANNSVTGAVATPPATFYRGRVFTLNDTPGQEFVAGPYGKLHLLTLKSSGNRGELVVEAIYSDASSDVFTFKLYDWFGTDGDATSKAVGENGDLRSSSPTVNGFRRLHNQTVETGGGGGDHGGAFMFLHTAELDNSKDLSQVNVSIQPDERDPEIGGGVNVVATYLDNSLCQDPVFDVAGGGVNGDEPDGAVDMRDFGFFQACITGPAPLPGPGAFDALLCSCYDLDTNNVIDDTEWNVFQDCWTGPAPAAPVDPACDD